jgi:hypothetical protein
MDLTLLLISLKQLDAFYRPEGYKNGVDLSINPSRSGGFARLKRDIDIHQSEFPIGDNLNPPTLAAIQVEPSR